jgi:hypothetical protein
MSNLDKPSGVVVREDSLEAVDLRISQMFPGEIHAPVSGQFLFFGIGFLYMYYVIRILNCFPSYLYQLHCRVKDLCRYFFLITDGAC